ncbi:MAG: ribonuclease III [Bacteroidales bacterium]|nr:ribonuclease III [Bacteroidales bacterium]
MFPFLRYHGGNDKQLARFVKNVFGFYPNNIEPYRLAFIHKSAAVKNNNGMVMCNERLEYLGDAVLSNVVAEFLFKKYPTKQEGFLTEMRARIVSRASLNKLSFKFGFDKQIEIANHNIARNSTGGNAFEAFCGALFLDKGYDFSYKIIVDKIINAYLDVDELQNTETNFKSRLLELCQKKKKKLEFRIDEQQKERRNKFYKTTVFIDDKPYGSGSDYSIKGAEQIASEKTWHILFCKENEKENKKYS